jgi:hypothetical protein
MANLTRPTIALVFLSGAASGVLGTTLALRRHPGRAGEARRGAEGPAAMASAARAVTARGVPRLVWPPPERQTEQVAPAPGGCEAPTLGRPEPGTPAFFRWCATTTDDRCSLAEVHRETFEEAARCGTLRADFPILELDEYQVADPDRERVAAAIAAFSAQTRATVDRLARELDIVPHHDLSLPEMISRIGAALNQARIFSAPILRQIYGERAGLAARPIGAAEGPGERYFRMLTAAGDDFERALAGQIGETRAHELRQMRGGWPLKYLELNPCPEDE